MKVLISCCARQKENIFREFMESLSHLNTNGLDIGYGFVFHNWPEGEALAKEYPLSGPLLCAHHQSMNAYVVSEVTHQWNDPLINDMILMKNALLRTCLQENYDYIFIVDSDLYLHPDTLQTLVSRQKDIIAEAFWTRWKPDQPELPNAWDYDHYSFYENSIDLWRHPGVYPVGGTGACILISANAIKQGVRFDRVPNVSWWGEDRYFQLHASTRGIPLWLDTTCPVYHIYRESALVELQRWKRNLPQRPWDDIRKKATPKLTAMMIVSNEANRYLTKVLDSLNDIVDDIAVVDDNSHDDTVQLCEKYEKARILRLPNSFFHMESYLRSTAWEWALESSPDWILAIDADEVIERPDLVKQLINQDIIDIWSFRIYDMWNQTHYRHDQYWTGHLRYRPMLMRVFRNFPYKWDANNHHSARVPQNIGRFCHGNSDIRIAHLGWAKEEDRIQKYKRYLAVDPNGEWGSLEQYQSILDSTPNLEPW